MKKNKRVNESKLKLMLKKYTPRKIIYKHIHGEITLLNNQIKKLIEKEEQYGKKKD